MNTLTVRKRMRPKASTPRQVIPRNAVSGVSPCITGERTRKLRTGECQEVYLPIGLNLAAAVPRPPDLLIAFRCFVSMRTEENIILQIFVYNTFFPDTYNIMQTEMQTPIDSVKKKKQEPWDGNNLGLLLLVCWPR